MVDDEVRVLDAFRRNLRGRWTVDTATSGAEGLAVVGRARKPYAVVVSDMMMPGMNGAEFLAQAHRASPDTVQIILSGQSELSSTIAAVNEGNLFRILTKPCETSDLARAVDAAITQYRLVLSERELLERTLDGAVEVLTELLAAANPVAARRTEMIKTLSDAVAAAVHLESTWELRIAGMLGQVGLMVVPEDVITQFRRGDWISEEAMKIYRSHPALSYDLIRRIPRLEAVAEWVAAQPISFDDATRSTPPPVAHTPADGDGDGFTGRDVYTAVIAFVVGIESDRQPGLVVTALAATGRYHQRLLDITLQMYIRTKIRQPRRVQGRQLMSGMLLNQDVVTTTGLALVLSGEVLTESMAIRLRHFASDVGVVEPINVLV